MKHNYYIGVITSEGEMKIAYKIQDKCMYWKTFVDIKKEGLKPIRFSTKHSAETFVQGLICNFNIAFVIDSKLDFDKDLIFNFKEDDKRD